MIKFFRSLRAYKALIIFVLFAPILPLWLMNGLNYQTVPSSPFIEFSIKFNTPQMNANEIAQRVSKIAEKNFNGISGLVSLSSVSHDEQAEVRLKFEPNISESSAYLLIQEKLDRIRLEIPSSVERIFVDPIENNQINRFDLTLTFSDVPDLNLLVNTLKDFRRTIRVVEPNVFENRNLNIQLNLEEVTKLRIPLSQIQSALKANGLKASIGQQGKLFFSIGDNFKQLEDINGIIVGIIGHRTLKLSDIATVQIQAPDLSKKVVNIELMPHANASEMTSALEKSFASESLLISHPKKQLFILSLVKFSIIFGMTILLQFLLQKYFFGPDSKFFATLLFNFLIVVHYVFWKSRFSDLSLFDLDVISLTEQVGNIMWFILLCRVRYYFLPQHKLTKIPRSLEQSTLLTMGELFPTFIVFYVVLILLSLPFTLNHFNEPSSFLLTNFLTYGMPINLILIMVLPVIEASRWIRNSTVFREWNPAWNFPQKTIQNIFTASLILLALLPVLFFKLPWGLAKISTENLVESYRSYGGSLTYLAKTDEAIPAEDLLLGAQKRVYQNFHFTTLGLKFLPGLDFQQFSMAIKNINSKNSWGYLETKTETLPLTIGTNWTSFSVADLYISGANGTSIPLKHLIEEKTQIESSEIYRERMSEFKLIKGPSSNLKTSPTQATNSSWTEYLKKEIKNHYRDFAIYLIFSYFVLAIYLNSFIRSLLLLGFLVLPASAILLTRIVLPIPFHVDSLWLITISTCLLFLVILTQTRIIDMDRTRGFDRDDSIADLKAQMLMPLSFVLLPFLVSLIAKSLISISGFWHEGLYISLGFGLCLFFINRYLFPLFYLESEEFIEKKIYNTYLFWRNFKQK